MLTIEPIAYVRNNRSEVKDDYWGTITSSIELIDEIPEEAFQGLDGYSHIEVLFHFHQLKQKKIDFGPMHPRSDSRFPQVGLYAIRKKRRPNYLGITIAKLLSVEGRVLTVANLDANDGSPVFDIKAIVKEFLPRPDEEIVQPEWYADLMQNYWR